MTNRMLFACLMFSLFTAGSSLSCRWLDHKFTQYSEKSLELLATMATNSSNTAEDGEHEVAFPQDLYTQASKASAVERLGFMVQILEQVAVLFEETHNSTSWEENTVEDFLNVITQQADGLSSCIWSHKMKKNKKLHMYFKRLSGHILQRMATNSSNTAEDAEHEVAFPQDLYTQASKASAVERLGFMVQILEQVAVLFEETHNSTSWEENTVEDFLNVITQQADGLSSCIWSHKMKKNKKLHMYFKRLSGHILQRMGHSAKSWELIRKETKIHLFKINQLVSSLLTAN
ncbi:hypothetical protein PAMP_010111 [Pampus punctatissimus]